MNNLNELKLMEAQINQIFQIIENAENREISKIAAETLANKCLDNPLAIFIIFKNFLEFSIKGKLRVFDDAGFLMNLILEEMDKDTIKKLFETDFFRDSIKNIHENNKFFYSFDNSNYNLVALENISIIPFEILDKISIENIEGLYSNKAEEWVNHSSEGESKGESFGKLDLEILFPIKDEIKQEIEQCFNVGKNNNNTSGSVKQSSNPNNKEKINISDFYDIFSKKYNLKKEKVEDMDNLLSVLNNNCNDQKSLLHQKKSRNETLIYNNNKIENLKENLKEKAHIIDTNNKAISGSNSNSCNKNNVKKRKIDSNCEQTIENLEFYFNPLFFVIEKFIKLNCNESWKARLCSISSLTLLSKFLDVFYYKFFKVSCRIVTTISKKPLQIEKNNMNSTGKKSRISKKSQIEKEIEEFITEVSIEDLKIIQNKTEQQNINFLINNNNNNDYQTQVINNNHSNETSNSKTIEYFSCHNFSLGNEEYMKSLFAEFEKNLKENLFNNLFINSLIDKVVDFDSEDYICIFKDLNLKLANRILDDLESEIDQMKENPILKDLNKSIYHLLNKAISANQINSDWQPIFSILTFLKLKMTGNYKSLNTDKDDNNYTAENEHDIFNKTNENINNYNFLNNYNDIFFGKNSFFNFSYSNKEYSIFSLIENLMKIDSEEIVNITIQILDKLMEKFNKENYNKDHINISKDKNKIISIYKNFILLINNYDDIEVGVKYYFNCLHNFIVFFKNLNEKNSSLEDPKSKSIIENDLIFYALNKNKSVRIKYFNLINNILEGNLINFSNHNDFIRKNVLLAIQGICVEIDEEIITTQKNFVINIINSNEEACLDVFFNFSKFILKLLLKKNLRGSKNFFIPNNEKFLFSEMEAFYSSFLVNDMQVELIKTNYERKLKHMIPIIANVMKNRINFVSVVINNLNLNFTDIKISKNLMVFLKIYYNYLELIDEMQNKTLIVPNDILNILIDNKKLDDLPLKLSKKDVDCGIGIALKFFLDFLEKYIKNYKNNIIKENGNNTNNNCDTNFLLQEFNEIFLIYNNLVKFKTLKIAEIDDLVKIIFNKIRDYENLGLQNNLDKKKTSINKIDLIYENFKIITNNIKKIDEDYLSLRVKIRAYSTISFFNHSIFSNMKFEKISIFINPILNCLKYNSKESKVFTKNLISMVFNHTSNLESRNKIINLFIDNCIDSYSDEIDNLTSIEEKNMNADKENSIAFNLNNPKNLKINFPLKYFFTFLSKSGKNYEMKKIFENFINAGMIDLDNNDNSSNLNDNPKLEIFLKKNIYFLFNISLINRDLNFIPFENLKFLLKQLIQEEKLLEMPYIIKYMAFIIMNFSKLIDEEDSNFDNALIIDQIFSFLQNNLKNNHLNGNLTNDNDNTDPGKSISRKSLEFIFKVLNLISDSQNFQLICINYIFDVIKFINSKTERIRISATNLFSKMMKIISYLKLDKSYEAQIINMKKTLKGLDNFNLIRNFVQQKEIKDSEKQKVQDDFKICVQVKENLRYYQIAGIKWLTTLTSLGLGLALCDDMGLGKTIQTLCCIANETKIYQEKYNKNPISLIICPNTLILNWIKESRKFFDESQFILKKFEGKFKSSLNMYRNNNNLYKYNNSKNEKVNNNTNDFKNKQTLEELNHKDFNIKNKNTNQGPIEVYVTSYDKIREMDEIAQEFFYVVLDEAHIIKNPKTKLYQNIKKISSERRIILTGTPIQNNVMELWSLFDFLMPGFLGTENDFEIKFHKKIYTNIKKLNLEEKLQENIFQSSLNEIRKRIKPFILRRLKQDVLKELPDKIIQDYICEMTPVQKELYSYWDNIYSTIGINKDEKNKEVNSNRHTNGNKKGNTKDNNKQNNQPILKIIDSMRKICNYPGLLLNTNNSNDKEAQKYLDRLKNKLNDYNSSGKLKALEDILVSFNFCSLNSEIINGNSNSNGNNIINNNGNSSNCNTNTNSNKISENKILIFSQYKQMLHIIKNFLESNFKNLNVKTLSSEMNEIMRSEIVNSFNSDPEINILLLTTSIGGLGLSLTAANIVIMYDHDWNPMRDLQAMDRAHRLGQKKTVEVFRLITADSIEEKLISLQTFKKYIANNVIDQSKIHESNLNMENFMESLEQFSNNTINKDTQIKMADCEEKKHKRKHIIESIEEEDERKRFTDELEFEYLKKLI